MRTRIFLCLFAFLLAGCTKTVQGYRFSPAKESRIQSGKSKIADIVMEMGNPTTVDVLDGGVYVLTYAQSQYYSFLFVRKKMISRKIVSYYCKKDGLLFDVRELGLEDENDFRPISIDIRMQRPNPLWTLPFYLIV
jgi:outer membrane protein assembly factor BamE (lipoprotein component of BamABCDE complex)